VAAKNFLASLFLASRYVGLYFPDSSTMEASAGLLNAAWRSGTGTDLLMPSKH
jgi:hypothetical protein